MGGMLTWVIGIRQTWVAKTRSVLLHGLFRTLYGPGASIYERFTRLVFVGEWRRWQSTSLDGLPSTGFVVELGCGTGEFAAAESRGFDTWIGLDISLEMTRLASRHRRPPTLFFVRADARAVPLKSGVADAVLATFPSNYVYDHEVLGEVRRVLKPEGRFVVVLTGELDPIGVRRQCTRAITRLLQGNQGTAMDTARLPGFAGMTGHFEWRATDFGRALAYTGRASPTLDGDCSPPTGDADVRATKHPPAPEDPPS